MCGFQEGVGVPKIFLEKLLNIFHISSPKNLNLGTYGVPQIPLFTPETQRYAQTAQNRQKAGKNRRNFASFSCVDSRKVLWVSKYFWRNFSIFLTFSPPKFKFWYLCGTTDTSVYYWDPNHVPKIPKNKYIFDHVAKLFFAI